MKTQFNPRWTNPGFWFYSLTLVTSLLATAGAMAQPIIVTTVPANGSSGVSTSEEVVFTFSEAMDTNQTMAEFISETGGFSPLTNSSTWSAGNTVLTCAPTPSWPPSSTIFWIVTGQDPDGDQLGGIPEGTFMTGTTNGGGGGTGGYGTNKYTTFSVGMADYFDQTSAGAPTPDTNSPYFFISNITLASNRTAVSATLTTPGGSISNMTQNPIEPDQFFLYDEDTNQAEFDAAFGTGNYTFNLSGSSNQQVTVNLPGSWVQPNSPHINNYIAAQAVDSTQPFTLGWDAFSSGTAKDYIYVSIGSEFGSSPVSSNSLAGTATSVVIPANTFQPNTTYNGTIGFLHIDAATNDSGYVTVAYIESDTQFSLTTQATNTTTGPPTPPTFANPSWSAQMISFTVNTSPNQNVTIQFNTNGLSTNGWQTLETTSSASGAIQVSDSRGPGVHSVFYRAVSGP